MPQQSSVEERRVPRKLIAFLLMVAVIVLLSLMLWHIKSETYQCTQNPLLYGVQNIDWIDSCDCVNKENCLCLSKDKQFSSFRVTKEGIQVIE